MAMDLWSVTDRREHASISAHAHTGGSWTSHLTSSSCDTWLLLSSSACNSLRALTCSSHILRTSSTVFPATVTSAKLPMSDDSCRELLSAFLRRSAMRARLETIASVSAGLDSEAEGVNEAGAA